MTEVPHVITIMYKRMGLCSASAEFWTSVNFISGVFKSFFEFWDIIETTVSLYKYTAYLNVI